MALQFPIYKRRKFNLHMTAREYADNLVTNDPYDVEGWMHIISRADKECTIHDKRYILNAFLDIFPTSARQWKYYIETEMYHNNHNIALELFRRCIKNKCYDVELYEVYIALCKKINEKSAKDEYLKNVNKAYRFIIKQVGDDIKSTSLWRTYLHFLKSNASALNTNHNIKDITLEIRRIYQAVIKLPIEDSEHLWNEYISWEKSLNPQLAEEWQTKLISVHQSAQRCYLERKRWQRGILLHIHIVPSHNPHSQERNYQQVQYWKRFIEFEALNKQNLNKSAFCTRMEFTFRQSLMSMALFPDIWLMYVHFAMRNIGKECTLNIYKQCIERLPGCLLVRFKYLEFLEANYIQQANQAFLDLLEEYPESTLIYIQYLHFLRRSESIAAAQSFFLQTISPTPNKHWQLYVAEALIEEHMNNNRACAQRILENGFKYFKDNPQFVISYVEFLMTKKDANSKNELQQIFDNILPQFSPRNKYAKQLWKLYIKFEQRACDLNQLHGVEKKRNNEQQCNRIEKILNAIERFSFLDLLPVSQQYRDILVDVNHKTQRKVSQTLDAMHTNKQKKTKKNVDAQKRIRNVVSRIKIHAVETTEHMDENKKLFMEKPLIDITNNPNHIDIVIMPDVSELVAFRPGVRFLQKLKEDNDEEEDENMDEDNEDKADAHALPPKIKALLDKLPPPQQTQLLKLDKNTSMIDVDSFLTFMKLKLSGKDI